MHKIISVTVHPGHLEVVYEKGGKRQMPHLIYFVQQTDAGRVPLDKVLFDAIQSSLASVIFR